MAPWQVQKLHKHQPACPITICVAHYCRWRQRGALIFFRSSRRMERCLGWRRLAVWGFRQWGSTKGGHRTVHMPQWPRVSGVGDWLEMAHGKISENIRDNETQKGSRDGVGTQDNDREELWSDSAPLLGSRVCLPSLFIMFARNC